MLTLNAPYIILESKHFHFPQSEKGINERKKEWGIYDKFHIVYSTQDVSLKCLYVYAK